MRDIKGTSCVVTGAGVSGLSAGWWLARNGVDVLVLDKGIVGWEASGRNGGGCTHAYSPFFMEEQKLWPQMEELLGYPTEYQRQRIRVTLDEAQFVHHTRIERLAAKQGFKCQRLTPAEVRELVPLCGDNVYGGFFLDFGGHANPQRTSQAYAWALQDHGGKILQPAAAAAPLAPAARALSESGACAGDPELGGDRGDHARRPSRERPPGEPQQRRARDHVERRFRPLPGLGPRHHGAGAPRPLPLRRPDAALPPALQRAPHRLPRPAGLATAGYGGREHVKILALRLGSG